MAVCVSWYIRLVVRILACHANGTGSIPVCTAKLSKDHLPRMAANDRIVHSTENIMKNVLIAILMVVGLSACVRESDRQAAKQKTLEFFQNPEVVGTLPDGRVVKVVIRARAEGYSHYIYYLESGEVTVNNAVPSGKSTVNQAVALLPNSGVSGYDSSRLAAARDLEAKAERLISAANEARAEAEKLREEDLTK